MNEILVVIVVIYSVTLARKLVWRSINQNKFV